MREAECSLSGLVEGRDKWHLQRSDVVTEPHVHVCLCPWVGSMEDDGATVERPEGAVVVGDGLVDTTAGVGPLGLERISTPPWINHTKVCGGKGGSREDSSECCREVHDCISKSVVVVR